MKWEINYCKEQGIVQVKPLGSMSWFDKRKLTEEILTAGRKKNTNAFLLNQKDTAFGLSIPEINRLPAILRDIGFGPKDKVSILMNPDSIRKNLLWFLQYALSLSPLQIKVFVDRQKATDWLMAKPLKRANPTFEC